MGALGWPPSEFWRASLIECFAALDGLAEFNGAKPQARAPSRDKVDAMLLRFPDAAKGRRA